MSEFRMAFNLDRLNGRPALPQLRADNVSVRGHEAMIELRLTSDHDIELYFPAPGGAVETTWLELAADVLTQLTALDNEVQRASAKLSSGSPYPSSYYEGELAHITLTKAGGAVLRYSVVGCNSQWDERFASAGGRWVRATDAEPSAAPDTGA